MEGRRSKVIAVVGVTGSGKSDYALDIAQAAGAAEIVSADAFQLYRGMDIGTAKVPLEERRGIVHHEIDVLSIDEPASVAAYQTHARRDIAAIVNSGSLPIVCGGSGLYVRALLDRLEFPGTSPEIRSALETEAERLGSAHLHRRLRAVDPASAERIDPANVRRLVRALEVYELTGRPFSATLPTYDSVYDTVFVALGWEDDVLRRRIDERTHAMFSAGLVDEVERLRERGLEASPTARRATGYPEVLAYLDGAATLDDTRAAVAQQTWRLVKRQYKWFKRDPRLHVIAGDDARARRRWCESSVANLAAST